MKTIKLETLTLSNFKGIEAKTIIFSERETVISGDNGTGKTTIFDAFTWLLFGKDSLGRSDTNFSIKTLELDGKPLHRLEHSVTGMLDVDGKPLKLQRTLREKWVKPRGSAEEVMQGHETSFYVNGVKLGTKKEYDTLISELITEEVFRMITNPFHFTSMSAEAQKEMLLNMSGGVSDSEIAEGNQDYAALLDKLSGRTLAQYNREIASRKKACKDALAVLPAQIETAEKVRPQAEDWADIEKQIKKKKKEIESIDAQLSDKSARAEAEVQRKVNLQKAIGVKRMALAKRENDIRLNAGAEANDAQQQLMRLDSEMSEATSILKKAQNSLNDTIKEISNTEALLKELRSEYRSISAEVIIYPEDAFVCPTCYRPLEVDDIEAKRREIEANFNKSKAERLKANQTTGRGLAENLSSLKAKKEIYEAEIDAADKNIDDLKSKIEQLKEYISHRAAPDTKKMVAEDAECISLHNEIEDMENQLAVEVAPTDADMLGLKDKKQVLLSELEQLYGRLSVRDTIARIDMEIEELDDKIKANNQALADAERDESIAQDFQKDKDRKLLDKINGMFDYVTFSFINEQINGGEKITCECLVDGVPYADVNSAGKINAGLDIINSICRTQGVSAPIFIDNAEGINQPIASLSQRVMLEVNDNKELKVTLK